jgi:hypothetical protein
MGASAYARQPHGEASAVSSTLNQSEQVQTQDEYKGQRLEHENLPLALSNSSRDIAVGCSVSPVGTVKAQLLTCNTRDDENINHKQCALTPNEVDISRRMG